MGAQNPTTAGTNTSTTMRASTSSPYVSSAQTHGGELSERDSRWQSGNSERTSHEECHSIGASSMVQCPAGSNVGTSCTATIPQQLAELLIVMLNATEGRSLALAFGNAPDYPPITMQSLSELDIPSIMTNPKLRHDVNFDRDLSFRPNTEGPKGQHKQKEAERYWKALVAELELYNRIFHGTPPLWSSPRADHSEILKHAERRIPNIFTTIQEVLKSLVPDRDHGRVDEHLDIPMLMQEIERGVCDLVKLAEWVASLLKEHCAPMRDVYVDNMVASIRLGMAENRSTLIVEGLRQLLGILEAMKLDIANHQIRNLKMLLIEDTVNFQRRYHLGRLVEKRARIDIDAARMWYEEAVVRFQQPCMPPQRDVSRFQIEVVIRNVVSILFSSSSRWDFPETFYLDQDRLRALKAEIDDLIHFEICFDMFTQVWAELGNSTAITTACEHRLRAALAAILGEGLCHGSSHWWRNSEHISIEIVRQAIKQSSHPAAISLGIHQRCTQRLQEMFKSSFSKHAAILESLVLQQILSCTSRHNNSSATDLFNALVAPPPPPQAASNLQQLPSQLFSKNEGLAPHSEQFTDLSNRITHIVLLHWRVWGDIAYVVNDNATSSSAPELQDVEMTTATPAPSTPTRKRPHPAPKDASLEVTAPTSMKAGEPPDPGQGPLEYPAPSYH